MSHPEGLAELQRHFARSLHYQASDIESTLAPHQLDGEQQLQIYRNNFIIGLIEVLAATYPKVKAMVGDECFEQVARQHVLIQPLQSGDVSNYGAGFAETIAAIPSVIDAVPYLKDLAELEWLIDRAEHSASHYTDFPFDKLQRISEDNLPSLTITVAEPVWLFSSPWAVVSLWQMLEHDAFEPIEMQQGECAVVHRHHQQRQIYATSQAAIGFIQLCQRGEPLANASPEQINLLGELLQQQIFTDIPNL